MSIKLTDPLVKDFIVTNAGEDAYRIMKTLSKGKTDEQISRATKLGVNDIRAHLNRLHYMGIIIYSKIKAKTSNWYTYTWFIQKDRVAELLKDRYAEELQELEKKVEFEQNYTFFKCANGCEKLPFEIAFEYDFKCPECGNSMDSTNSVKEKANIEKRIKQIQRFLNSKKA